MQAFAIIPAAGRSRRMGRPKLLLPWRGAMVIEHVLAAWRASRVDHFVAVLHHDDHELAQICARGGAFTAGPESPPPEMKDSIRQGLAAISRVFHPQPDDAWLVAPADMPGLSAAVIDRLIDAHAAGLRRSPSQTCIRVPRYGPRQGHPVLFPWTLAAEVDTLGADQGLNALVARHPVEYIDFDAALLPEDFDTPDDYERLRSRDES